MAEETRGATRRARRTGAGEDDDEDEDEGEETAELDVID